MFDCPSNFDTEQVVPVAGGSIEDCDGREAEFLPFISVSLNTTTEKTGYYV